MWELFVSQVKDPNQKKKNFFFKEENKNLNNPNPSA